MTKKMMLLAVLATLALSVSAEQYPFGDPWFPTSGTDSKLATVLPVKWSVSDAFVEPMIDPPDAYAFTFHFPAQQSMSQCPILPHWKIVVEVQPQLDETRAYIACPPAGCYCAIFVPDRGTALNYELARARFRQGAPPMTEYQVQFRIPRP